MIKVIFPNGHERHYHTAQFFANGNLYTEKGGKWICTVPEGALVEAVSANTIYDPHGQILKKAIKELEYSKHKFMDWNFRQDVAKLKKMLSEYNAKTQTWK
jgi:hypothetical protein